MKIIEYREEFGEVCLPEGFAEKLAGKTLEEQTEFYKISESTVIREYSYGDLMRESEDERLSRIEDFNGCTALIVKDGIIVGVTVKTYSYQKEDAYCLPFKKVCTYSASEDDGTGGYDRDDYVCLLCV